MRLLICRYATRAPAKHENEPLFLCEGRGTTQVVKQLARCKPERTAVLPPIFPANLFPQRVAKLVLHRPEPDTCFAAVVADIGLEVRMGVGQTPKDKALRAADSHNAGLGLLSTRFCEV